MFGEHEEQAQFNLARIEQRRNGLHRWELRCEGCGGWGRAVYAVRRIDGSVVWLCDECAREAAKGARRGQ